MSFFVSFHYVVWTIFDSQGFSVHPAPQAKWTENPWLALMLPKNSCVKFFLFNLSSMILCWFRSFTKCNGSDRLHWPSYTNNYSLNFVLCSVISFEKQISLFTYEVLRIIFVINYYAKKKHFYEVLIRIFVLSCLSTTYVVTFRED